jgi:hypothetical protein
MTTVAASAALATIQPAFATGLGAPPEHALISLLALNGLR